MSPLNFNKKILGFVVVFAFLFSFSVQSFAQNSPINPGGGTTATPSLTPTKGGQASDTSTPGGITPITPITPDINNEQILEGTGTTTVDTKKAPSSIVPTAPIVGEQTPLKPASTTVNTTNETVRTGGLEIGLGLIAIIALGIGYYYYKKKGDKKSVLKTTERKIRF
jgi:hypothetical protein